MGLTPIENDRDVLRFVKDVEGIDSVDIYVEHAIDISDIVYEEELGKYGNFAENVAKGDPNVEVDNMDEGVTNVKAENVAEGLTTVEGENMADGDNNVEGEDMDEGGTNVEGDSDDVDFTGDSDDDSIQPDCTTVLHTVTSEVRTENVMDEDLDQLYTPPVNEDEQEYEHFPNLQISETLNFKLGFVFNNKDVIKDVIKEYEIVNNKNVFFKKNDGRRMLVNSEEGYKYYMRFSKRARN